MADADPAKPDHSNEDHHHQMFAKVLEDKNYTADLLKKRSGFDALAGNAITLFLYFLFILGFNFMVLSEPMTVCRQMEKYVRSHFDEVKSTRGHDSALAHVHSVQTFYEYMESTIIPRMYDETGFVGSGGSMGDYQVKLQTIQGPNKQMGSFRIRTVRIKKNRNCAFVEPYSQYFLKCYGDFDLDSEDRQSYGAGTMKHQFLYVADPEGVSYSGQVATYPASGFVMNMGRNKSQSLQIMEDMKSFNFVDEATRALFLEFTVWNGNMDMFVPCRIVLEVTPGGKWANSFNIDAIPTRYIALDAWMLIADGFMLLFVLFYIGSEISECSVEKFSYFYDGWNLLDLLNLFLILWVILVIHIPTIIGAGSKNLGTSELADPAHFTDLHDIAASLRQARYINALNSIILYLKILKYASSIPYVETLLWTLKYSFSAIVAFVLVFLMTFFGFVLAYRIGFGDQFVTLSNIPKAFFFLSRSFVGSVSIADVYESNPLLGLPLVVLFVICIICIMMNLFSATMIQALANAHERQAALSATHGSGWERLVKKFQGAQKDLAKRMDFQRVLRTYFRGLHARLKRARIDKEVKKKLRAQQKAERIREMEATMSGPMALTDVSAGVKLPLAGDEEDENSDAGSDVEVGALRRAETLRKAAAVRTKSGRMKGPNQGEIMLGAVQQLSRGLMDRTNNVRALILEEMTDTRTILQGMSDVVEVLMRRVEHLEIAQSQYLEDD